MATGEIAETVPVTPASTAVTETEAGWPSLTSARSLSTTSVVTWKSVASMTIAVPDGASKPALTS